MARMRKEMTPKEALMRLEELCAKAEYCENDMQKKLQSWSIPPDQQQQILESLKEKKFIDNERFVRAYVHDKFQFNGWGKRKIMQQLYLKRIDRATIAEALSMIDEEEYYEKILAILQSKLKSHPELIDTFEGRTKLYRHAITRGFDSATASKAIKHLYATNRIID